MTRTKFICFFVILALLICGAALQHVYLTTLMSELLELSEKVEDCVSAGDFKSAAENAAVLGDRFDEESHTLSALLDHGYICDVYEQLRLLKSEIALENADEIPACCASLKHALECINQLESVNIENIF